MVVAARSILLFFVCLPPWIGNAQQTGPCSKTACGDPTRFTATINCGECNSGYFVLTCTCCEGLAGNPPS